jgi:rhodanese-related sulfurtransferase
VNTTDKPTLQKFHIEGVKHIAPDEALKLIEKNEAVLIDVREQNEVALENIPLENVLYHPMSVIMDRLPYIAKDQNIILGCPGGVRSAKVANLLNLQGYPNVANLDGGFSRWKSMGLPYKVNLLFSGLTYAGGGCGCGTSSQSTGSCC